jgi:hypothetical protein
MDSVNTIVQSNKASNSKSIGHSQIICNVINSDRFIKFSTLDKINRILNGEEDLGILNSLELWALGETPVSAFKDEIGDDDIRGHFYTLLNWQEIFWGVVQELITQQTEEVVELHTLINHSYSKDQNYDYTPSEIAEEYLEGYKDFQALLAEEE